MNIEKTLIDDLSAELSIHLQPADYQERVEKALKNYRKRVQMPGFRNGQVPASIVKQRFGKSILAEEVNSILQDSIYKYINENKLEILGSPIPTNEQAEVGDWDNPGDFQFKYELGLAPTFDVQLDNNLVLNHFKVAIDDTLIDRQIKDLARRYGKMSSPDESTKECMLQVSLVELDANGQILENGIKNDTHIALEYLKDESTQASLTNRKKGDHVTIDPHKLTANHQELADMLGITHEAVHHLTSSFQLTINDIKHLEPSPLNEELFTKLFPDGSVNNEADLKTRVAADLEQNFERDTNYLLKREFAKMISDNLNLQLPDEFLKKYITLTNEKPLTPEILEREYPSYAGQLRWELIEGKIIRQYELRVTQEEALDHVKGVLKQRYASYGLPMDDEELLTSLAKETLAKKEEAKNIYDFLYEEKILGLVKEKCTLNTTLLPFDEFVNKVQHS